MLLRFNRERPALSLAIALALVLGLARAHSLARDMTVPAHLLESGEFYMFFSPPWF